MNILIINCKKDSDNSYQHTVFKIGRMSGKRTKEIIFNKYFSEIIGKEYVPEFINDPKAFVEKYI